VSPKCSSADLLRPVDADSTSDSIPIHERVELPESWIPADSRVEIDAKINAGMVQLLSAPVGLVSDPKPPTGYFTTGHRMTEDELKSVQGRIWEE
jgi:hypothetical protein